MQLLRFDFTGHFWNLAYTFTLHSMLRSPCPIHHCNMHICIRLRNVVIKYNMQMSTELTYDEDSAENS